MTQLLGAAMIVCTTDNNAAAQVRWRKYLQGGNLERANGFEPSTLTLAT
jgi:hypothetical protein